MAERIARGRARNGRGGRPARLARPLAAGLLLAAGPAAARAAGGPEPGTPPAHVYRALLINGHKVGHTETERAVADGQVTTTTESHEHTRRGDTLISRVELRRSVESAGGLPLRFQVRREGTGQAAREFAWARGDDGQAILVVVDGDEQKRLRLPLAEDVLMPEGERLLRVRKGFVEGTSYTYRKFAPVEAEAAAVEVTVGPTGPVDVPGGPRNLTELTVRATGGEVLLAEKRVYVDAAGTEWKRVARLGGQDLVTVVCDEAFALGKNDPQDLGRIGSVDVGCALPGFRRARAVTFVIRPKPGCSLELPESAGQEVRAESGGRVTVVSRRPPLPRGVPRPYAGDDPELLAATRPTRYLSSGDERVRALARRAADGTEDAADAVRRVDGFLRTYLRSADNIAYATAAEVAASRRGDCTEYAVLAVAMFRALGLPSRIVGGVVYSDDDPRRPHLFVPHAWAEVRLGDGWYAVDPIQLGAHAARIAFSHSYEADLAWHGANWAAVTTFLVESAALGEPREPAAAGEELP